MEGRLYCHFYQRKRPNLERLGHVGEIVTLGDEESNYQSAIASICC
ncbi:hypothetical protein KGEDBEEJ_02329 [Aeromonas hydrophila]